jgi:hypothetical protein
MKARFLVFAFLSACAGSAPLHEEINTQEFIFFTTSGRSFMHVLASDWEPVVENGFLRINDRQRMLAMDVIMIRPRVQLDVTGLEFVRLVRRNESSSASGKFDLWVLAGIQGKIGLDKTLDLVRVAPHTWLRPNDFRLLVER